MMVVEVYKPNLLPLIKKEEIIKSAYQTILLWLKSRDRTTTVKPKKEMTNVIVDTRL